MITLILLHPLHRTPVQSWSFQDEPSIRIGRAMDNQVVLYSAVVSRHHVELQRIDSNWEIVHLGTNQTYWDDKPISQVPVVDGMVIRLARSGPQIQIRLGAVLNEGTTTLHKQFPVPLAQEQSTDILSSDPKATYIEDIRQPEIWVPTVITDRSRPVQLLYL